MPVATRANLRLFAIICFIAILLAFYARDIKSPLSLLWPYLLFVPALLLSIGEVWGTFFSRAKNEDGELVREVIRRKIQRAFDQHDTHYRIGGWDRPAPHQPSTLALAATEGDLMAVETLLNSGANPNQVDQLGWTPLSLAVAEGKRDVVDKLLEFGADANIKNLAGRTALMFACRYGFADLAEKLIDHGADPNVMPVLPEPNALMVAAQFGHEQVVRLLLSRGADAKAKTRDGKTAIEYAQIGGHGKVSALLRNSAG